MSKENFKYYALLLCGAILFYKLVNQPDVILDVISFISQLGTPFILGGFIAILLSPVVTYFQRTCRLNRGVSILVTYMISFFVLIGIGVIVIPSILKSIHDAFLELSVYFNNPSAILLKLHETFPFIEQYLEEVTLYVYENLKELSQTVIELLNSLSTTVIGSILGVTSQLINTVLGITISIYLLADEKKVMRAFTQFICVYLPQSAEKINYFVAFSYQSFQEYMIGRLIDSLIIGILAYIGFLILDAPYVALFAFIVFITNIIPYFGPIIGGIPPFVMTLFIDPAKALWVAIFIICLQQLDGNVIGPKIMGDKVGLSPLWIISAVIIGGSLFGFIGFFLAVPAVAVIKELYDKMTASKMRQLEAKKKVSTISLD